jgi:hypothetical protein
MVRRRRHFDAGIGFAGFGERRREDFERAGVVVGLNSACGGGFAILQ